MDKFKINLNQNLWGLVVAYAALGAAEHWNLKSLMCPVLIFAWALTALVLVSNVLYTWEYCLRKYVYAKRWCRLAKSAK